MIPQAKFSNNIYVSLGGEIHRSLPSATQGLEENSQSTDRSNTLNISEGNLLQKRDCFRKEPGMTYR